MFFRGSLNEFTGGIYSLSISTSGEPQGEPRRLTLDQQLIVGFDWTSDGKSIVFSSGEFGRTSLSVIEASGATPERLVGRENAWDISISRAANRLVYTRSLFDSNIWRIPGPNAVGKNSAATRFIASTRPDLEPQFSPVYYAKHGSAGIWKIPVEGGEETQVLDHGSESLWALADEGIFFGEMHSSVLPVLKFYRFTTRQTEIFKEFSKDTRFDSVSTAFSVSPDGQWIVYHAV